MRGRDRIHRGQGKGERIKKEKKVTRGNGVKGESKKSLKAKSRKKRNIRIEDQW
jgi:hypothetical protein